MSVELDGWLHAAADAAAEVASGPLGISHTAWRVVPASTLPNGLWGAYIPLLSPQNESLQLALLAGRDTCERITRALLGMSDDEAPESDNDIIDAVGEVTNLVAGGLKARLEGKADVRLGVPLALSGREFPDAGSQSALGILQLDRDDVWLVLTGTSPR
jgi:Chemotaxis phosphatase CheX